MERIRIKMQQQKRWPGFILVIIGASFWGITGTVSQRLFQSEVIQVEWLVTARLLIAGVLLLCIQSLFKNKEQILHIWQSKATAIRLVIFSTVGMIAVQYTYLASIKEGNAAVATMLQYLAPVFIILYLLLRRLQRITGRDLFAIVITMIGTFLLLTNGAFETLSVPIPAVIWGILSGITLAFYTLYAVPLLRQFDSLVVVGWAMVIGGVVMSFVHAPWQVDIQHFNRYTYLYLAIVIFLGTMLAFWFFVESLRFLSPKETTLIGTIEPVMAVVTSVLWLGVPFGIYQVIGTICILIMVIYLSIVKE